MDSSKSDKKFHSTSYATGRHIYSEETPPPSISQILSEVICSICGRVRTNFMTCLNSACQEAGEICKNSRSRSSENLIRVNNTHDLNALKMGKQELQNPSTRPVDIPSNYTPLKLSEFGEFIDEMSTFFKKDDPTRVSFLIPWRDADILNSKFGTCDESNITSYVQHFLNLVS